MTCRSGNLSNICLRRLAARDGMPPSSARSAEGNLGQWPLLTSVGVKGHYKQVYVKKSDTYSVSGLQEPPNTASPKHCPKHCRHPIVTQRIDIFTYVCLRINCRMVVQRTVFIPTGTGFFIISLPYGEEFVKLELYARPISR